MILAGVWLRCICGTDLNIGKSRNRRGRIQSCDSDPDDGRSCHGRGNGVSDTPAERNPYDPSEKLDLSDSVRTCDRSVMAMLLPGAADR